jgi:CHAT domain-containing protein/tetratricopeptide (TPR) repeat protein
MNAAAGITAGRGRLRPWLALLVIALALPTAGCRRPGSDAANTAWHEVMLGGSRDHAITLVLDRHERIVIEVEQRALDVRLSLEDCCTTIAVDSAARRDAAEILYWQARRAGPLEIRIEAVATTAPMQTVRLRIERPGATLSETGVRAYVSLTEAERPDRPPTSEATAEALEALEQAFRDFLAAGLTRQAAATALRIGHRHFWQTSNWREAITRARVARRLYRSLDDRAGEAAALHLEGAAGTEATLLAQQDANASAARGQEHARVRLRQALQLHESVSDPYGGARDLNYLGVSYAYTHEYDQAAAHFQRAEAVAARLSDRPTRSTALLNLAALEYERGNYRSAAAAYENLRHALVPADDWLTYADALHNEATASYGLGRIEPALLLYGQALEVFRQHEDAGGTGRALHGMASAYFRINDVPRAKDLYAQALQLRRAAQDGRGTFVTLLALGDIERQAGAIDRAIALHEQARTFAKTASDQARAALALGLDDLERGRAAAALGRLQAVAQLSLRTDHPVAIQAHVALGRALAEAGESTAARKVLEEASERARDNDMPFERSQALLWLSRSHAAGQDLPGALQIVSEAIAAHEQLRLGTVHHELRARLQLARRALYATRIEYLGRMRERAGASSAESEQHLIDALLTNEAARSGLGNDTPASIARDSSSLNELDALYSALSGKKHRLDALLSRESAPATQLTALRGDIAVLRARIAALERSSAAAASATPAFDEHQLRLLQAALPPQTALVDYALDTSSSLAWVIRRDSIRPVTIVGRAQLDALAARLGSALRAPDSNADVASLAMQLRALVIDPLSLSTDVGTLIVVAEGPLRTVPFRLLIDSSPALRARGLSAISMAPSLSALRRLHDSREPLERRSSIAVLAAHDSGVSAPDDPLAAGALRGARDEISAIQRTANGRAVHVLPTATLSHEALLRLPWENHAIVHIVAHTSIDPEDPGNSALWLRGGASLPTPDSLALRTADIRRLQLDAALVVLSGCETALGGPTGDEGVFGLGQAFLDAGSEQLLMTLWKVPDEASAHLIASFYDALLGRSRSAAAALEQAQDATRSIRKWSHPYYWAGFVLATRRPM